MRFTPTALSQIAAKVFIPLLLTMAAVPAMADIHDEFNDCQFNRLPKLKKFGFRSNNAVDQFCIGWAYWHSFVYTLDHDTARTHDPFRQTRTDQGQIPHDPVASAQWMARAAAQGHAGAETLLAYYYEQGHGVPKDYAKAVAWLQKALAQNYPDAMFQMGRLTSTGKGVPQNEAVSQQWIRKAAEAGSTDAIVDLRKEKEYELEKPAHDVLDRAYQAYQAKDYVHAAVLYKQAADAGNPRAMSTLGTLYRNGLGVPKNPQLALQFEQQAAAKGLARAAAQIGFAYEFGEGVAENWTEAAKWCAQSARQYDQLGLYCLGRDYQFGIGVPQDRQRAIRYFDLAEAQGNDAQSRHFHESLRDPTSCIGYRNDVEREHFLGVCEEPKGIAFTNENQRDQWLGVLEAQHQAAAARIWAASGTGKGSACSAAGGTPSGNGCIGERGVWFDPNRQDRTGRPLW